MSALSEKQFQTHIRQYAENRGWLVYSIPDSRRCTSAGFPDLVLARNNTILFRELKTDKGRISKDQRKWIEIMKNAGLSIEIWRPQQIKDIYRELK